MFKIIIILAMIIINNLQTAIVPHDCLYSHFSTKINCSIVESKIVAIDFNNLYRSKSSL